MFPDQLICLFLTIYTQLMQIIKSNSLQASVENSSALWAILMLICYRIA